jgi:MFS family permease
MSAPRRVYYGWVLVWALGITTIVSYGTTQYLFGVLVVPIQHDLGWSRGSLSGAFSLGFVVAGLTGVGIGRLVDRSGARWLMTAGSLLGASTLALLSRVSAEWQFYVLWAGALSVSMALTFYPVTFVVITNWFNRRRGSAMALLTLIGGFASVIFIPLAGLLIAGLGWRTALLVMAACQLAVCVPIHALVVRRHPEDLGLLPDGQNGVGEAVAAASTQLPGRTFAEAVGSPAFWTLTGSAGLALMGHAAVLAHQVPYMIGRGYDPVFAAGVAGLLGVASLPARLVMNLLSDRFGPRAMLILSTLLQAVGVLLLVNAGGALVLWAYVAVYGFAFGAVSPLRASVMAEYFGRRAYGAITAAQGVPVSVLTGVGPLAAGTLYDRLGDYRLAFALTIAAFLVAALALALTPPAREAPSSPPERAPTAA